MNTNTQAVMFGKASDEWRTPKAFFDRLDAEFGFDVDAAATADNALCGVWFGLDSVPGGYRYDALTLNWRHHGEVFWLNPPYSKCREFIAKARKESLNGCTVVCLVPSRTDTRWWHEWVYYGDGLWWPGVEVRFVKGRLKFGGTGKPENSAPFPSVVIIFRPHKALAGDPRPAEEQE